MRIRSWKTAVLGLALAVLVATSLLSTQSLDVGAVAHGGDAEVARGQYLATIMDCAGCHTPGALAGQPEPDRRLASSVIGFALPGGGIVYPKNLTPDLETGLGRWTEEEVARAIRQGEGRDGRALIPVMPWPSYSVLTEADSRAIAAYLKSVPPVRFAVPRDTGPGEKPEAATTGRGARLLSTAFAASAPPPPSPLAVRGESVSVQAARTAVHAQVWLV